MRSALRRSLTFCAALFVLAAALSPLAAEDQLPDFGDHAWVNGQPLTPSMLKGKIAVIRFYEAACPTCRATWVSVNKMAHPWKADKNILFIGISSGYAKSSVQSYASAVKLDDWQILVDEDRSFEKNFGFVISLQNIFQAYFVAPDGSLTRIPGAEPLMGNYIQQLYDQHRGEVVWKIDPKDVPEPAKPLWQAYEYSQWSIVMQKLPEAERSNDAAVKAFAAKIRAGVNAEIKQRLDAAKAKDAAGEKWNAFKLCEGITTDFGMTADTREAATLAQKLRQDRKVTLEFNARDIFLKGKAMLGTPNQKQNGIVYLKSLVDNYKDTEAAIQAQALLAK